MTLIGYGVFDNSLVRPLLTGNQSSSAKIYKHKGTAKRVAKEHPNSHVRELYVKDFADAISATDIPPEKRTGVIFVNGKS